MFTRHIMPTRFITLCVILFHPIAIHAEEMNQTRYWECFPVTPGRASLVHNIAEDSKGRIWIMNGFSTHYWNATNKEWVSTTVEGSHHINKFYGGPETGLYATQKYKPVEEKPKTKPILKGDVVQLDAGDPKIVTQFIYDYEGGTPGFHVLGRDRFLNWCNGKIRIYAKGKWTSYKADLHQYGPTLLQGDGFVSLVYKHKMYVVGADNKIKGIKLDPKIIGKSQRYFMLGKQTAVVFEDGKSSVRAFHIRSGKEVELKKVNAMIQGGRIQSLDSTPDGCLWISVDIHNVENPKIIRVAPDGTPSVFEQSMGPEWPFKQMCTKIDAEGSYWCITPKSVLHMRDGQIKQFDSRADGSPAGTAANYKGNDGSSIFCDSRGIIYVGGETGQLFAYNRGESLTGATPFKPVKTVELGDPLWKVDVSISNAWYVDGMIFYSQHFQRTITAINATDGKPLFTLKLEREDDSKDLWVQDSAEPGRILVTTREKILTVDAKSGEILATVVTKHNNPTPPIGIEGGHIVPRGYEGDTIVKLKNDGTQVWERKLSDRPHLQPTERIGLLIVQLRGHSSSGGTVALDSDTGEIIWENKSNDLGQGLVFLKDPSHMVELNNSTITGTTLVCRESITGKTVWTYSVKSSMSHQAPIVDTATDRIYFSLSNGGVHCVDGKDGKLVWNSSISATPARSSTGYISAADFHGMVLLKDKIAVVGTDGNLYLLDSDNGSLLRRFKILEDIVVNGMMTGTQYLASGPWVREGNLIIPSRNQIRAYPLKAFTDG